MSNVQLAKNLLTLRKLHNMTQDDLGRLLNISRQAYSNYETGKRTPDLDSLMILVQFYNITLDELIVQPVGASHISEDSAPFHLGMDIATANTIYLTEEETQLILNYRNASKEKRQIVSGFLQSLS